MFVFVCVLGTSYFPLERNQAGTVLRTLNVMTNVIHTLPRAADGVVSLAQNED